MQYNNQNNIKNDNVQLNDFNVLFLKQLQLMRQTNTSNSKKKLRQTQKNNTGLKELQQLMHRMQLSEQILRELQHVMLKIQDSEKRRLEFLKLAQMRRLLVLVWKKLLLNYLQLSSSRNFRDLMIIKKRRLKFFRLIIKKMRLLRVLRRRLLAEADESINQHNVVNMQPFTVNYIRNFLNI